MEENIERLKAALADVEHDLKIATKNKETLSVGEDGFAAQNCRAAMWESIYFELKSRKAELQSAIKKSRGGTECFTKRNICRQ